MEVGANLTTRRRFMRELRCADVGMKDCNFVTQGKDDAEVMKKAGEHARSAHKMSSISPELEKKVRAAIREVGGQSFARDKSKLG
jgi:predicted small metal-binding protein